MKFNKWLFELIREDDQNDREAKLFDIIIIILIFQSVIAVVLTTFPEVPAYVHKFNRIMEYITVTVFTIEYIARVYVAHLYHPDQNKWKVTIRYVFSFMALIDLISILPFYLPMVFKVDLRALRMLRLFRLLRIFKLNRYFSGFLVVINVLKKKKEELIASLFVVVVLMIVASILMYFFEHEAQPTVFENAFSGLWWAVETVTTLGYGDIYPVTFMGRLLATFIAFLGIALVAVPTGIISAGMSDKLQHHKEKQKNYCPNCGEKLH